MKRALAASLILLLTGWTPAFATDGSRHESDWHSSGRNHEVPDRRHFMASWGPALVWIGHRHDPLWSWDDGFFADLQYERDHYGYWRPYRPSGEVEVVNGEARYHYDRGYPYRHYDYGRDGAHDRDVRGYAESASIRCRTQWVWSSRDRRDVPVRICS